MENKIVRVLEYFIGALLIGMVVLLFAQVLTRYVLQGSLLWASEMATWLFVWMVYIGSVVLYMKKKHVVVDIVSYFLPRKVNAILEMISSIIIFIFMLILFKESIPIVISYSKQTATAIEISKKYLFSSLSVATFLMIFAAVFRFVNAMRRR